ncbi:fatty acid desaturase [Roseateles sp. DC23W]|uniref:Fatty acid desaturase n=1 Tax=Pelomonas dachongensis TaxID=3299029 RepID=A0ABW7EUU5_9BURK
MNLTDFLFPAAALPLAALGAMHLKVKGSSVLVHFGSHRMGFENPRATRIAAEVVGVATLNISVEAYRVDHEDHHGLATFARAGRDPDATLLDALGLVPGMDERALWRRFTWTLASPVFHWQLSKARLAGAFVLGPAWRIVLAWSFWGALAAGFAAAGLLLPWLLGFVMPVLLFGNIGAILELASEHRFNVEPATKGRERQALLSHARLLGAPPPVDSPMRQPHAWARWAASMAGAMAVRVGAWPGDLSHHDAHHIGVRPALKLHRFGWMNAAYEFSPSLRDPAAGRLRRVGSLREAIDAWFKALARERGAPPTD